MSWALYLGLLAALTAFFAIIFAMAYSLILGIRDNYFLYYQKAELQWTGPRARPSRKSARLSWLLACSVLAAWIVLRYAV